MNFIVFDIEFLTPTNKNDSRPVDIISLSAIHLNQKGKIDNNFEMFAKPKFRDIDERFTNLTGITVEDLNNAVPQEEILSKFTFWLKQFPRDLVMCCWSSSDMFVFINNCKFYKFSSLTNNYKYFDIQKSHMYYENLSNNPSLKDALIDTEILTPEEAGSIKFHNSTIDAKYTTKLFRKFIKDYIDDINYNCSGASYNFIYDICK